MCAVGVVGAAVGTAAAGPVTIQLIDPSTNVHSGWQATIFDEDHVDIVTDSVNVANGTVVIEKFAEFTQIGPLGTPEAINIVFQQVLPDAQTMTTIAITDELIINSTGMAWLNFEMFTIDSGQVAFDPVASAAFSIAPFTTSQFGNGNTLFHVEGGVIPDGGVWTPGLASGALYIDVDLAASTPVTFTLKELPSVPSPGSFALLSAAGLCAIRRRR
jgi:MYXO-CTERM domain-containing protein